MNDLTLPSRSMPHGPEAFGLMENPCCDAKPAPVPRSGDFMAVMDVLQDLLGDVLLLSSLDDLSRLPPSSLLAVYHDDASTPGSQVVSEICKGTTSPKLLLLSERKVRHNFAELFGTCALNNLLMLSRTSMINNDLAVTIRKMRSCEIFGMEQYFSTPVEVHTRLVTCTAEKNQALDAINDYVRTLGIPSRLRAMIVCVADECLTNGLYNAPVTEDGRRKYASRSRTEAVVLEPGEHIEFRYCCDGRRFAVSASDPFGSLEPSKVREYIARGFRSGTVMEGTGGAGIGLFQIFDSLSHLVINIEPGRRTEMIGMIDVSAGYRNFTESGKSFNIFVK